MSGFTYSSTQSTKTIIEIKELNTSGLCKVYVPLQQRV